MWFKILQEEVQRQRRLALASFIAMPVFEIGVIAASEITGRKALLLEMWIVLIPLALYTARNLRAYRTAEAAFHQVMADFLCKLLAPSRTHPA